MTVGELSARDSVWQMIDAYQVSRAIYVAATLGIADLLKDAPRTADELAVSTETDSPSLYRLLRALASIGVFAEDGDGRFGLTPRAEYLRSDVPGSVRARAVNAGGPSFWSSWAELPFTIRTGETAFRKVHGMSNWEYRERHPEENAIFNAGMTAGTAGVVAAIVDSYDFSRIGVLADVGGGEGALLAKILATNPPMRGILFDQPHVANSAGAPLRQAGVADRCEIVGGDFFQAVPSGADAYLLKSIIHDWDDERAIRILRRCRDAMPDRGKLLLVELIVRPANESDHAKFLDLHMMVMNGGRERTADDYRRLYAEAGFSLSQIVSTGSGFSIIEGTAI
jgi:hypothetical protein